MQIQPSPSLKICSEEGDQQKQVHEVEAHQFYSEHARVFISRRHIPSLLFNSGPAGGSSRRNGSTGGNSASGRKSAVENNSNLLDLCILVRPVLQHKIETTSMPTKQKVDDIRPAETNQASSSSSPTGFRRLRPGSILPIPSSMLSSTATPESPDQNPEGTSDSPTRNPWRSLTAFSLPWQRSNASGGGGGNRILDSSLYYSALRTRGGDGHSASSSSANNSGTNNNSPLIPKEYVASELYTFCVEPGAVQRFQHQAQYLTVHNFPPLPLLLRQYMVSIQHKDEEASLPNDDLHHNDENRAGNSGLTAIARGVRGANGKATSGAKDPALATITTYSHEVYTVKEIFNQPRALYHSPHSMVPPPLAPQQQTTSPPGTTGDATAGSNSSASGTPVGVPIVVKMIAPLLPVSPAMTPQASPQIAVRKSLQMSSRKHHPQLAVIGPDTMVLPQSAESLAEEMRVMLTQQLKDKQRHKHHAERELRRQQRREQRRNGSAAVPDGAMDGSAPTNVAKYGKIAEIPAFRKPRPSGSDVSQLEDIEDAAVGNVSDVDGPNNHDGSDPSQPMLSHDFRRRKHHHGHHRSHQQHSGARQHRRGSAEVASVGEVDEGEEEEEEEEKDDIPDGFVTLMKTSNHKHHVESNSSTYRKKVHQQPPAATDNTVTTSLHNSFINSKNDEANQEEQTSVQAFSSSDTTPEDNLCVVCLSAPRCIVLFPCRHCLLCWDCAQTVGGLSDGNDYHNNHNHNNNANKNKCPMCRTPVLFLLRLPVVTLPEDGNKVVNASSNNLVTNRSNDCADNTTNNTNTTTTNNTNTNNTNMTGNINDIHGGNSMNSANGVSGIAMSSAQIQRSPRTIVVASTVQREHQPPQSYQLPNTAVSPTDPDMRLSFPVSGPELEMISRQWLAPPISHSSESTASSTPSASTPSTSWSAAVGVTSSSFSSAVSPAAAIQLFSSEDLQNDNNNHDNIHYNNTNTIANPNTNTNTHANTNPTNANITTSNNANTTTTTNTNPSINTRLSDTNDISNNKVNNNGSSGNHPQGIVPGAIVPAFSIAISRETSSSALSSPRGSMYPHALEREDTLFDFLG